jgi:hypothetical protein
MDPYNNSMKKLATSFNETISSSELVNISAEIVEITIDSVLKEGVLKELPIVGSLIGVWKTGAAINDYRFLNKLLLFLNESSKLSDKKRQDIIEKLEDKTYQAEAGEKLIAIIDSLETSSKAKMLGKALCLFGNLIINRDEFWRVSYIIDKLPMSDIIALKDWKENDLNKVFDVRKHLYLSVGIGWYVLNTSSTGFCWQERLCSIFADNLIEN